MKKQVKVIRSANQTVVIYRDPPKQRALAVAPIVTQKPVVVRFLGVAKYVIMPSGRMLPVRFGKMWRIIKSVYPRARFAVAAA
jgi:hypothetical protein